MFDQKNGPWGKTAIVQKEHKNHFTVTPIANITDWRKEQEKLEAEWHKGKMERFEKARASAMEIYAGEKQVELLTAMDKAEISYVKSREEAKKPPKLTWEAIQAKKADWDAKNESRKADYAWMNVLPESPVSPKPSLFQRAKRAIARFVREAFPQ